MPSVVNACAGLVNVEVLAEPEDGSPKFQTILLSEYPEAAQLIKEKVDTVGGAVKDAVWQP